MTAWIAGAEIKGVVFIDSMVPDLQTLLGGLAPGERAFVLDMSGGGLEQIATILADNNLSDVGSIAIVGHGASGSITVGTTVVNDADLAAHAAALKSIGAAVKPGGSLDLFSCDTAAGPQGRAFIADLAKAAGVTVDAATHQIGRTTTGPDWTLDARSPIAADGSGSKTAQADAEPQADAFKTSAAFVQPATIVSAQSATSPSSPFAAAAMQSYSGTLATGGGTSGQLFVSNSRIYTVYSTPGGGATASFTDQGIALPLGFDTVNGLFFSTTALNDGTGNYALVMTNTSGTVLGKSDPIANTLDGFMPLTVDPLKHLVYAYTFTGTGNKNDAQQNQIFDVTYDPTAHTFGKLPYSGIGSSETATQGTSNPQSLVNTASDPTFGAGLGDIELDAASNQLFYTTRSTSPYTGPDGYAYPSNNEVYFVDTTMSNGKQTQITSSTQFPVNGAVVNSLALDTKNRLVYFTTEARSSGTPSNPQFAGESALYVISMDARGSTTATLLTNSKSVLPQQTQANPDTAVYDYENLSFDPATQSLYVRNGDQVSQVSLNAAGTAVTSTKTIVTGSNFSNLYFNALPNLVTTATGTMAVQNGAAVNLLSSAPTITDPDSGGYLKSASVQVTQGGTVRAGDKLLIAGTSFGAAATAYTDTTGARFNISYSTGTNTLNIASISNAGTGITTTTAQYSSLLSKLQYQDGYTDNTTGTTPTRTFTYHVSDGAIGDPYGINTTTNTISVARAPVIVPGGYQTIAVEGQNQIVTQPGALEGDSDPGGGTLTVSAVQGSAANVGKAITGTYGTLTLNSGGDYRYSANNTTAIDGFATGSHPVDNYSFTVSNNGGSANEAFAVTIDRKPVVTADTATVTPTAPTTTGNVLRNDSDPDGDALTVSNVAFGMTDGTVGGTTAGTYGDLTLNADGSYSYSATRLAGAPTGQKLTDSFGYMADDGSPYRFGRTPSTLTITVSRNPTIAQGGFTTTAVEGATVTGAAPGALAGDVDPDGGMLSVTAVQGSAGNVGAATAGTYGSLTLRADGSYSYAASNNAAIDAAATGSHPVDSYGFTVSNGSGTANETFATTLDRGPVVTADTGAASQDAPTTMGNVLNNDRDPDGDALAVSAVSANGTAGMVGGTTTGAYGDLTLKADGSYSYSATRLAGAPTGQKLTDTFAYAANDGHGGTSFSTLAIALTRDPTIAQGGFTTTTVEGATVTGAAPGALAGDVDPDGGTLSVTAVQGSAGNVGAATAGTYGSLTLQADGSYSYAASNNAAIDAAATGSHPVDSYGFTVSNGSGTATETFTTTLDRAPVTMGDSATVAELGTTTGNVVTNDTDPDGDALTVATVSYGGTAGTVGQTVTGKYGDLTLNADGSYSYNANNVLAYATNGAPRTDDFTYTASDGMGGTSRPTTLEFNVVCFVSGTRIATARGDVAVEDLVVGDLAVTAAGARRPITWIGHRTLDFASTRVPDAGPVRIRAGAFGRNRPERPLRLSPGHPVLVGADEDGEGGVLVPIMCLVNGTTIVRESVERVTYWHVELDSHDILLAEGLPAESYLDWGDRPWFGPDAEAHALANPDHVVPGLGRRCRPVAVDGPEIEAERRRLDTRFALDLAAQCAWPGADERPYAGLQ